MIESLFTAASKNFGEPKPFAAPVQTLCLRLTAHLIPVNCRTDPFADNPDNSPHYQKNWFNRFIKLHLLSTPLTCFTTSRQ